MATTADLIHRVRRYLMTGQQDRINVLDLSVASGADTLQLRYDLKTINEGTRLTVGLEEYMVLSINSPSAGGQAIVIPGFDGSPQSAHTAGDVIRANPQFSDYSIFNALNESIIDLAGEGCFRILPLEFTYIPGQMGYDVTVPDFMGIWRVRYDSPGIANNWMVMNRYEYMYDVHPNPTEFPGGHQFVVKSGGSAGFPIRISYKASFDTLATLTDDVLVVSGLPVVAHDLPVLGAAIKLLSGREVKRNFLNRQPEPRRQSEVPPGAINQSMESLLKTYATKLGNFKKYLARLYPDQTS